MSTIDLLLPTPLKGSGGHRTIVANAEALAAADHRVRLHVQESRRIRNVVQKTRDWHGVHLCETSAGWPTALPDSDAVMATTWFTAGPVAAMQSPAHKLYFVQDYEPLFFPAGDLAVAASASYELGLRTLVIGRWLQHKLATDHSVVAWSVPFTADPSVYRASEEKRQPRVVAIYQPDKPRRCPELTVESLRRLMDRSPVDVVTVGSSKGPSLGPRHTHLGVISQSELAQLYRTSFAGLCLSASNPSRVPFEMMACGLPVVELGLPNTIYDLPSDGCLLARPDPESLAGTLQNLLDDEEVHTRLSIAGARYMRTRAQVDEANSFVNFVEGELAGGTSSPEPVAPLYTAKHETFASASTWIPGATLSRLRRGSRN